MIKRLRYSLFGMDCLCEFPGWCNAYLRAYISARAVFYNLFLLMKWCFLQRILFFFHRMRVIHDPIKYNRTSSTAIPEFYSALLKMFVQVELSLQSLTLYLLHYCTAFSRNLQIKLRYLSSLWCYPTNGRAIKYTIMCSYS